MCSDSALNHKLPITNLRGALKGTRGQQVSAALPSGLEAYGPEAASLAWPPVSFGQSLPGRQAGKIAPHSTGQDLVLWILIFQFIFEPIACTVYIKDLCMMDDAVDNSCCHHIILEYLTPVLEVIITRQDDRSFLITH